MKASDAENVFTIWIWRMKDSEGYFLIPRNLAIFFFFFLIQTLNLLWNILEIFFFDFQRVLLPRKIKFKLSTGLIQNPEQLSRY